MNDPDALAEVLAWRQEQRRKIEKKIDNVTTELASQLDSIREEHSTRRKALLHSISLLDAELAQSEATIIEESSERKSHLREKLRKLKKENKRDKKAMSFATLPPELLAEVFRHCVEGDTGSRGGEGLGFSPQILALVSRKWYEVALATGKLWRTILVTDTAPFYWKLKRNSSLPTKTSSRRIRTHSAMQVCTTGAELESALQRVHGTACILDVTIGFPEKPSEGSAALHFELYEMLFNDRIAPRIRHLTFENWSMCATNVPLFEYTTANFNHLSKLACVTIADPYVRPFTHNGKTMLRWFFESVNSLTEIVLAQGTLPECLRSDVWTGASYSATIQGLQRLVVTDGSMLDEMFKDTIPIPEVIIAGAAQVERTKDRKIWELDTVAWPIIPVIDMNFTRITRMHLILDDLTLLSCLTFPVLEHLRLTQSSRSRRTAIAGAIEPPLAPDPDVHLPRLSTLRITARHLSPANQFDIHRLGSFHMTSTHSTKARIDKDFSQLFSLCGDPTVDPRMIPFRHIHALYVNANVSEKLLVQALGFLPLLKELKFVPGRHMTKVLVKGLTVEKPKYQPMILCPALEVVELDLVSFIEWDRQLKVASEVGTSHVEELSDALYACVDSRREAGKPLLSCTLIRRKGKRQYVES